jgi:hypothetical protein
VKGAVMTWPLPSRNCPHNRVGTGRVEVNVHGQLGPERGAGEREDRVAGAVTHIGVLVGEGLPVGVHDDDVPGGGQVGLEVV